MFVVIMSWVKLVVVVVVTTVVVAVVSSSMVLLVEYEINVNVKRVGFESYVSNSKICLRT